METRSRKAEYAEATRKALVEAATELFATKGFADTSIEDVVREARVTKGALYHHFAGKAELFREVVDQVQADVLAAVYESGSSTKDPLERLVRGTGAFLDACLDPRMQRICMREAPVVLGWEEWRDIDAKHSFGMTKDALRKAMEAGAITRQPVEPLARVLIGALNEAAFYVARADDPRRARREVGRTIRAFLEGLRPN